jgi:hypothetical protein
MDSSSAAAFKWGGRIAIAATNARMPPCTLIAVPPKSCRNFTLIWHDCRTGETSDLVGKQQVALGNCHRKNNLGDADRICSGAKLVTLVIPKWSRQVSFAKSRKDIVL